MGAAIVQIFGKVQGVGFRYYAKKTAEEMDIRGFVKNRRDGSVYMEVEGKQLEAYLEWCHKGPDWARVDKVLVQNIPSADYKSFEIR